MPPSKESDRREAGAVEQEIVQTLESLSRRLKSHETLPGLPGAKRPEEEVMFAAATPAKA